MNRRSFTAAFAVSSLAFPGPATAAPKKTSASGSSQDAARAAQMISRIRNGAGLPPVAVDAKLTAAAEY